MAKPVSTDNSNEKLHRAQLAAALNQIISQLAGYFAQTPQTATAASGAATLHAPQGAITSEALVTAAGADYALTLTSRYITKNSIILASADNGTNTIEGLSVQRITPSSGNVLIRVRNTHASLALNGTIKIRFQVLSG